MNQINNQVNTTVVINQPFAQGPKLLVGSRNGTRDWTTGLFGCCEDCGSMCMTCFCIHWTIMQLAVRLGDCICMPCCVPGAVVTMRTRTRTLGDISGSICKDWCAVNFCTSCAVCQMDRELTAMGL